VPLKELMKRPKETGSVPSLVQKIVEHLSENAVLIEVKHIHIYEVR